MQQTTYYGIVEFNSSLFCASDVIGRSVDVTIGGQTGRLIMPSLPSQEKLDSESLHAFLLGPAPATTWKQGDRLIFWGRPTSLLAKGDDGHYSVKTVEIMRALLGLPIQQKDSEACVQKVYEGFQGWMSLFEQYIVLLTGQNSGHSATEVTQSYDGIEICATDKSNLRYIRSAKPTAVSIVLSGREVSINFEQLVKAAQLSSQVLAPRLEYQLLLEAYRARVNNNFRQAIIEAATALEICLTNRILDEFDRLKITFGEKLLDKFRMLGGRFDLVRLLGISLPQKDYVSLVINPRNDVMHRANFPDRALANQVIAEVEELLKLFSPQIYEDRPS